MLELERDRSQESSYSYEVFGGIVLAAVVLAYIFLMVGVFVYAFIEAGVLVRDLLRVVPEFLSVFWAGGLFFTFGSFLGFGRWCDLVELIFSFGMGFLVEFSGWLLSCLVFSRWLESL